MKTDHKTLAVIGAGPVGGILAAHLCAGGHTVLLVDSWKEHLERIRSHGLLIRGGGDAGGDTIARPAHLYESVASLGEPVPDFVFICTKGCDLDSVLGAMSDRLRDSRAVFVSFQNGIDTEQRIVEYVGAGRVLRAVVSYAGVLTAPGVIRRSFFTPPNYIGALDPAGAEACRNAAVLLTDSGITTEVAADIRRYAWRKTILNTCTMAIAAVTGMNMQELAQFPPTAQLADQLLDESIAVAAAHGFDYGPGFADTVRSFNRRAGPHRPSMSVDLEKGRRTENAFLVRRIAEYGEMKGVPVPLHRTLANLIDALELKRAGSKA